MIRGTTPTVSISVDENLEGWEVYVTFQHANGNITKTGDGLAIQCGDVSVVSVPLSQEDTLAFPEGHTVKVQMRAVNAEGTAIATEVGRFRADEVLLESVIPTEEFGYGD